jgi:uncharacterized protein YxjI
MTCRSEQTAARWRLRRRPRWSRGPDAAATRLNKEYDIRAGRSRGARVSREWFRLRDAYVVDVTEGTDVPLILAIAVCVDRLSAEEHESAEIYAAED